MQMVGVAWPRSVELWTGQVFICGRAGWMGPAAASGVGAGAGRTEGTSGFLSKSLGGRAAPRGEAGHAGGPRKLVGTWVSPGGQGLCGRPQGPGQRQSRVVGDTRPGGG